MRPLRLLDPYRWIAAELRIYGERGDDFGGVFRIKSPTSTDFLGVIAAAGDGWDYVSVSLERRCPTWSEMEHVKRLFFRDDETAMQLHVPPADHINAHPYCLHIWRPHSLEIPRPPAWMVGDKPREAAQ